MNQCRYATISDRNIIGDRAVIDDQRTCVVNAATVSSLIVSSPTICDGEVTKIFDATARIIVDKPISSSRPFEHHIHVTGKLEHVRCSSFRGLRKSYIDGKFTVKVMEP